MDAPTSVSSTEKHCPYPPKRREKSNLIRKKLILSAVHLGAKYGFSNMPLREAIVLCNSNMSSIHHHFKGREGLLREIVATIDSAWPSDLPDVGPGNIPGVLCHFLLNLERLKQHDDWQDHVVRFIARLCMEDAEGPQIAAATLLAPRLSKAAEAVELMYPAIPAAVLRQRVSIACLLLLTFASNLDHVCMAALNCEDVQTDPLQRYTYAVTIAASIIMADWPSSPDTDVPAILLTFSDTVMALASG